MNGAPTTLGQIFQSLLGKQFKMEPGWQQLTISVDAQERSFKGTPLALQVLEEVVKLRQEECVFSEAMWFWFESDDSFGEPHELHHFFVVSGDRIVQDHVAFSDYGSSGFDPSVFEDLRESESTSSTEEAKNRAELAYWYQRFYSETRIGQIMVLRLDHPKLHYYQGSNHPAALPYQLRRIYRLLLILVILEIVNMWLRWK